MPSSEAKETWIYHERQEAMLCGQHALNNLVQACVFTPEVLSEIAHTLNDMELRFMADNNEGGTMSRDYLQRAAEENQFVDASGNFSIEVLRTALMNQFSRSLPSIFQENMKNQEVTDIEGFICNREAHWFAIRKINGLYWNLNSTLERPEQISHFRLAAEISSYQTAGYSVFCVDGGPLPVHGRDQGLPQCWWREDDLLAGKSSGAGGSKDPWKNVGQGMRLDGQSTRATTTTNTSVLDDLTEEEMLQMALAASMQESTIETNDINDNISLRPEPNANEATNTVKIQFRLPNGKKTVRRFFDDEVVAVIYIFVKEQISISGSQQVELRSGFPPRDLQPLKNETIKNAKLSGEMIQCRLR